MKANTRKIAMGLLSLLIVTMLAACGGGQTTGGNGSENSGDQTDESNAVQGVTDSEILVGLVGPQTGPAAFFDASRKGVQSYINYVNENGGVNGKQLKLIAYDDQYQPAKTVQLVKRLVEEDKVFALLSPVGSAPNLAALDYYKQSGIPVIMMGTGQGKLVDPPVKNIIGESVINYGAEAKVFLDYAVNELGAKKIAIAYQNDDLGKEGLTAVKDRLGQYDGVEIVEEVNYLASDADFSSQAQKLKNADPDVVMNFGTPATSANLKKAMYKIGLKDVPYINNSVGANDPNLFKLAGEEVWNGTISGATLPMPEQSDDESARLYVERFSQDYPDDPLIGVGQSGWASAEVFVEALKRTEGELNWNNFLDAFYTFDNWDGSMYVGVTFSENNHFGLTSLFMTEAIDGEIVPISDTIHFNPETGDISY
ncbi:MAG: ABC transporter substrate-binding protein [Bacillaceae bacterium]|nr:ABC transporter substrate-binding protein [Bacillaceae bacterium]